MKHETYDHGPFVEAWLKEPTWLPQTDLARVRQIVHQTPQRRARLPRLATERFRPMFSATTIAAGVAVVALTGGLLMSGVLPDAPADEQLPVAGVEATASAGPDAAETTLAESVITLPESLPAGVEGGTFDTPAGPARWVSVKGPMAEMPRLESVVQWGDGLAIWEGRRSEVDGRVGSLWASSDGTDWRPVTLPDDYDADDTRGLDVTLSHKNDAVYLAHPRLDRLWRSTADGGWKALDTSVIAQARPTGWATPAARIDEATTVAGEVVLRVEHRYTLPRRRLGLTPKVATSHMRRVGPDRYALCQPNMNECSESEAPLVLRFKQTDDGLVVRDDRTGERLGLLAGADPSELYEGQSAVTRSAYVLRDDRLVPTTLPGHDRDVWEQPPAGVPDGAEARRLDSGWVAWELRYGAYGAYGAPTALYMHIGDEWVDLASLGFPTHLTDGVEWRAEGVGNAVVFWVASYADGTTGVWVLTLPDTA